MVKRISIIILVFMALVSCRAFRFQPIDIPQKQLPPLKSKIDVTTEGIIASFTQAEDISTEILKTLCSSEGNYQGSIECDVELNQQYSLRFGAITSVMSFGLLNVIGLPFGVYENQADVTLRIYDSSGNHIGTYQGVGYDKKTVACYYGYSIKNATQTSIEQALVNAMNEALNKIQKDYMHITTMLDKNIEQLKKEKEELKLDFKIKRNN